MSIAHTVLIIHDAIYPHLSSSQFELGYKGRVTTRLACSRQIILIDRERGIVRYWALWKALIWLDGGSNTCLSLVKRWTDEWLLSWQSPYFSYIFEPRAWIACPMFNVQMKTDHTNQVCYWHFISSSYNNSDPLRFLQLHKIESLSWNCKNTFLVERGRKWFRASAATRTWHRIW